LRGAGILRRDQDSRARQPREMKIQASGQDAGDGEVTRE
jgi:hypothetical protein